MPKYVYAYHGSPKFETKQAGADHMVAWKKWSAGLGDAVVDPGLPVGPSMTVNSDGSFAEGGGANPISGVTIVQAESMDKALAMAKACPHIAAGGSIEVAEAMELEM
jgi:hypothetical protein